MTAHRPAGRDAGGAFLLETGMRFEDAADWARDCELTWCAIRWITSRPGWADDREAVEAVCGLISVLARPISNLADHHCRGGAAYSEE